MLFTNEEPTLALEVEREVEVTTLAFGEVTRDLVVAPGFGRAFRTVETVTFLLVNLPNASRP